MILEKLQSLIADQLGVDGNTITIGAAGVRLIPSLRSRQNITSIEDDLLGQTPRSR